MPTTKKHVQFHDGPHHIDFKHLPGKEVVFEGVVAETESGNVVNFDEKAVLRIAAVNLICANEGVRLYQVDAVGVEGACFAPGEPVRFQYDAFARQSEEIPVN